MRFENCGVIDGGQIVVVSGSVLNQRQGEPILEALRRVQAEAEADSRPPDVVVSEAQWRDLTAAISEWMSLIHVLPGRAAPAEATP